MQDGSNTFKYNEKLLPVCSKVKVEDHPRIKIFVSISKTAHNMLVVCYFKGSKLLPIINNSLFFSCSSEKESVSILDETVTTIFSIN